jgi:hypothetical protein
MGWPVGPLRPLVVFAAGGSNRRMYGAAYPTRALSLAALTKPTTPSSPGGDDSSAAGCHARQGTGAATLYAPVKCTARGPRGAVDRVVLEQLRKLISWGVRLSAATGPRTRDHRVCRLVDFTFVHH